MANRLSHFEVIPYALPFREDYVTSKGRLDRRELILLRVTDDDGLVGLGEAVPLALRGGDPTASIAREIEGIMAELTRSGGIPSTLAVLSGDSTRTAPSGPARCAIRTAIADLEAKRAGVPLFRLLAPESEPAPIELNATIGADDPAMVRREARDWGAAGFSTFKVKVGDSGDVERVRALRDELGPGPNIRVDANGAWGPEEALERASRLAEMDIELFEEPVTGLERLAEFRRQSGAVVVADESVSSRDEARRAAELEACDAITVKLSKIGDLDSSLGGHLPTYLSSALDGPVGIAAALHVAMTPGAMVGSGFAQGLATSRLFRESVALGEPDWLDGPISRPPESPGLGIELDEPALSAFRL